MNVLCAPYARAASVYAPRRRCYVDRFTLIFFALLAKEQRRCYGAQHRQRVMRARNMLLPPSACCLRKRVFTIESCRALRAACRAGVAALSRKRAARYRRTHVIVAALIYCPDYAAFAYSLLVILSVRLMIHFHAFAFSLPPPFFAMPQEVVTAPQPSP